jgi:hypothetical protein
MSTLDLTRLAAPLAELLRQLPLMPLGPGKPDPSMRAKLAAVERDLSPACRAGLWLAFDFLDESHSISQELSTVEGCYWHALMDRREPDYWNSKYWFRRVGNHPVFAQLAGEAARLGWRTWDAEAFVDACERECGTGSEREQALRQAQLAEWRALFAWCFDQAGR